VLSFLTTCLHIYRCGAPMCVLEITLCTQKWSFWTNQQVTCASRSRGEPTHLVFSVVTGMWALMVVVDIHGG
jgi:hypothetical protein